MGEHANAPCALTKERTPESQRLNLLERQPVGDGVHPAQP
jgi:hypothetical protein